MKYSISQYKPFTNKYIVSHFSNAKKISFLFFSHFESTFIKQRKLRFYIGISPCIVTIIQINEMTILINKFYTIINKGYLNEYIYCKQIEIFKTKMIILKKKSQK